MHYLFNPSIWGGLFTLIALELILGIDNIIFITILSRKLPNAQQDRARLIGLILALIMRFFLLFLMSWLINLTKPILINKWFIFSARDIILLIGGLFLFFKALLELHERCNILEKETVKSKKYSDFWYIVLQISVLDTIFSIDSIITAVGMVNNIFIMIFAISISSILMFFLSKILTKFINLHQTVIILCLSFILMIGLNLITEALGFYIPKGYLYTAISFSVLIEFFNQLYKRNFMLYQSKKPIRIRILENISRIMQKEEKKSTQKYNNLLITKKNIHENKKIYNNDILNETFKEEEKYMLHSVLILGTRSIRSMMTPRQEISWININNKKKKIRKQLLKTPHNLFPVCNDVLDEIIGVIRAKELMEYLDKKKDLFKIVTKKNPIIIPDTLNPIKLLNVLRRSKGNLVIVGNEFGVIQGLITPVDILEAIAGEFPDEDEMPDKINEKGEWIIKGSTDLYSLGQLLNTNNLINQEKCTSLSGLLIAKIGRFPKIGEIISIKPFLFKIIESSKYQINLVCITKNHDEESKFKI